MVVANATQTDVHNIVADVCGHVYDYAMLVCVLYLRCFVSLFASLASPASLMLLVLFALLEVVALFALFHCLLACCCDRGGVWGVGMGGGASEYFNRRLDICVWVGAHIGWGVVGGLESGCVIGSAWGRWRNPCAICVTWYRSCAIDCRRLS